METDTLPLVERSAVWAVRASDLAHKPRGARSHGDEFFRRCRMQCHGRVEIGLFGAHFYGNSQKLRHLAGILAENMHAEDAVCRAIGDDLHQDFLPPPGEGRLQGAEVRQINIDALKLRPRVHLG